MSYKTPVYTHYPRHRVGDLKTRFVYDHAVDEKLPSHTKSFQKLLRKTRDLSNHAFPTGLHVWYSTDEDEDALVLRLPKKINFDGSKHVGSRFKSLRMRKVSFYGADICYSRFPYCDMRKADFTEATLMGVNFLSTNLQSVDFRDAELFDTVFEKCELKNADFSEVDLRSVTFHHCHMTGMIIDKNRGLRLEGERPFLKVEDVGGDQEPVMLFLTNDGPWVQRGCFFGSLDSFRCAVRNNSDHFADGEYTATGEEYQAIIELFDIHHRHFGSGRVEVQGLVQELQ